MIKSICLGIGCLTLVVSGVTRAGSIDIEHGKYGDGNNNKDKSYCQVDTNKDKSYCQVDTKSIDFSSDCGNKDDSKDCYKNDNKDCNGDNDCSNYTPTPTVDCNDDNYGEKSCKVDCSNNDNNSGQNCDNSVCPVSCDNGNDSCNLVTDSCPSDSGNCGNCNSNCGSSPPLRLFPCLHQWPSAASASLESC